MHRILPVLALLLSCVNSLQANGILIPEEKSIPPLAMVNHRVSITMEDQVAVTRVEQTFRNHTDRQLEATYVFPVPRGASVNKFTMWVNGREMSGELLEAAKARQIYTDIVRRTQDPGLLEYMGNNLFRMKVFPIPPKSDQKVALSYTSVANRDAGLVEYIYPLKTDGKATSTLDDLSIQATIKSQQPVQNIYSPTHAITIERTNDREVSVKFQRNQGLLDKDFQLFYSTGDKDVGFTAITHRPISSEKGFFLFLVSPRMELPKDQIIPRDMILVLDTSGSMRGAKMDQAKRALKYCLDNLADQDRFAMINFATTVTRYKDGLVESNKEQIAAAKRWVDNLEANGGTAIDDALAAALDFRTSDSSRTFTIVFFTDGLPTIGESNPEKILKNVMAKNTANTRIFTFGVGDDVNATFLDQLAENTRAVSTYVRPAEDIEAKVSSLYSKISHPVLANLKLVTSGDIRMDEIYPPQLPDLFHGGQMTVLGRYTGQGPSAVRLTGMVGGQPREFVYEITFPAKTTEDKGFTEHLWARRKVGYLLDQIRANGEKKELVDETVALAKKYGIATPYTSYLIVPDSPVPVASGSIRGRGGRARGEAGTTRPYLSLIRRGPQLGHEPALHESKVVDLARSAQSKPGEGAANREEVFLRSLNSAHSDSDQKKALEIAAEKIKVYDKAREALSYRRKDDVQTGKLGVDLSIDANNLRNQDRLVQTALRNVAGRNCMEIGGVWIDEGFDAKTAVVTVKAMSAAYFRILERHPEVKAVFQLGNYLVWLTPSGTALVIDTNDGKEELKDTEIDGLFVAKR
jgi:Ca-activated chloride channel family protein